MTDILLDRATGDVDLTNGIELVDDVEAIAQQIYIRLRTFLGEWFLDTRIGVPYFQKIIGKKRSQAQTDLIFRRSIQTTPGIASVTELTQTFDAATRELRIAFRAVTTTGVPISFSEAFVLPLT